MHMQWFRSCYKGSGIENKLRNLESYVICLTKYLPYLANRQGIKAILLNIWGSEKEQAYKFYHVLKKDEKKERIFPWTGIAHRLGQNQNLQRHQQQNKLDMNNLYKILLSESENAYIAAFTLPPLKEEP